MSRPQIPVVFSVEIDRQGVSHVTYRSMLTPEGPRRVGGKYLKQYSGRRGEMDILTQELQIAHDNERAT